MSGYSEYGYLINAPDPPPDAIPVSPPPEGLPSVYRVTDGLASFADPDLYFDTFYPLSNLELLAIRYQEVEEDPRVLDWLAYVVHEGFHRFQDLTWAAPPSMGPDGGLPTRT